MNTSPFFPPQRFRAMLAGLLCLALLASAANAAAPAKKDAPAAVPKPAAGEKKADAPAQPQDLAIQIPRSDFDIPTSPSEGRNPFFPASSRMIASGPVKTSRPLASVSYALQGISGTATKRFAIINGRTFEVDEEAEIAVGNSRVRIRCLEIRADSVLIESSGEKRELKLRRGL